MARTVASLFSEKMPRRTAESATQRPATVAASTPAAPINDASTTRPLRILYIYRPTNKAMGIVQAIVNVPQELPGTSSTASAGSAIVHFASGASGCCVDVGTLRTKDSGRMVFAPDG